MIPALIQIVALLVGYVNLRRQYPFALLSLLASLPILLVHPSRFPHPATWERYIWLPCAIILVFVQSIAALEALFQFGSRYFLVPRLAMYLSIFAGAAAACFLRWPTGDVVGQMVQVAVVQRAACAVFLLLSCGFYASVTTRDLFTRPEGAHLLLLTVWMTLWMIPALRPLPTNWPEWFRIDWPVIARACVVATWIVVVALRERDDLPLRTQSILD